MNSRRQGGSVAFLFSTAVVGLWLVAGLAGCFWQPDSRDTAVALHVQVPDLSERAAELRAAVAGGDSSTTVAGQSYSGEGLLTAYIIEESYLRLAPEELDQLFEALEDAQDLSQEELETRYPAARIRTLPINFALGTAGSLTATGLKGDATYVIAVFADSCEGDSILKDDGWYGCVGLWYQALDFTRVRLPAGETTRVNLRLNDKFDDFARFLFDQYGYDVERYDDDDWDEEQETGGDEGSGDESTPEGDTGEGDTPTEPEPDEVGTYRVYAATTENPVTISDGTDDYVIPFGLFAWEYRGLFSDGTNDFSVFHVWWYDSNWQYSTTQDYNCVDIVNCARGADRLQEIDVNQEGGFVHGRIFADPALVELPGSGFFGVSVEFMKLSVPQLSIDEFVSETDAPNDIPSVITSTNADSEIVDSSIRGRFPGVTSDPFGPGDSLEVQLQQLVELP